MPFLSSRRWRRGLAGLAAVLLLAAGIAWWQHTSRPEYRLQRGREALQRDDYDAVAAIADRLEAAGEPDRAELLRGEALVRQRRFPEALATFNRIGDKGEIRLQAAVLSARCLLELRELNQALRVYTWILGEDPGQVDAYRGLAAIAYDLGQFSVAIGHLEKVAQLDSSDGRPHWLLGQIYKDLSGFPAAEAAYREALRRELPPASRLDAQRGLAEALLRQTRFAEALEGVEELGSKALAGDRALQAEALRGLQRNDEARAVLEQALKDYPRSADLLRLRGELYLAERKPEQAVSLLERAVGLAEQDDRARYQLGLAYTALGRTAEAAQQQRRTDLIRASLKQLTDLSREAGKQPFDADIRVRLAELCDALDKPQLAAMWRQAAAACRQIGSARGQDPTPKKDAR
jgi:tetratricopeptide (TPR) repeat protein